MIKVCQKCGGFYATEDFESFAGAICTCVTPEQPVKDVTSEFLQQQQQCPTPADVLRAPTESLPE